MQLSEQTNELFDALAKFQGENVNIEKNAKVNVKDKSGKFLYSFEYATLGEIITKTKPALAKHGLSVTQGVGTDGVRTLVAHQSGQWLLTDPLQIDINGKEQDQGSSITYKKRYQMSGALRLDADLDEDGNAASGNVAEFVGKDEPTKKKQTPKKPEPEPEPETETSKETSSKDDATFIANCEDYGELIEFWKNYTDNGGEKEGHDFDDSKTNKEVIMERLDKIS